MRSCLWACAIVRSRTEGLRRRTPGTDASHAVATFRPTWLREPRGGSCPHRPRASRDPLGHPIATHPAPKSASIRWHGRPRGRRRWRTRLVGRFGVALIRAPARRQHRAADRGSRRMRTLRSRLSGRSDALAHRQVPVFGAGAAVRGTVVSDQLVGVVLHAGMRCG